MKHNQDSYEAVWEHVHGRPVAYPKPHYQAPVLLEPERFEWRHEAHGVLARELGRFNGFGLRLAQLRLAAGARFEPDTSAQDLLLFCLDGTGQANGEPVRRWTTLEAARLERVELTAGTDTEFFLFGLPRFDA